ncbi:GtrA family protein [Xanthomonas campestris pv. passiflorae]|uniref:GtrA family protein n=1 Tax=Xanthomonas campestris TaxID=339 RepID=UPI0024294C89|nr:GtrA family protein [Xanthomonas campestris]MBV6815665.1 GtrA family protein [Xanthomonas campestris pv. passiflorae]
MTRQALLFLVAGGIAAGANFGSRIALSHIIPYVPAIVTAYVIGMITAFALNRAFVFKNPTNSVRSQAVWFVLINLLAVAQTVLISLSLSHWLLKGMASKELAETIAHAVGVAFPVFTSFAGHKYLSFRTH